MSSQSTEPSRLEKCLLELLDPRTTPEKALQTLKYSLAIEDMRFQQIINYRTELFELVILFAYIRFIMMRAPEACVDGIWEDILWKTIKYSQESFSKKDYLYIFGNLSREIFKHDSLNRIVPTDTESDGLRVRTWFNEALSTPSKCPNPYIRLELFRMMRLFQVRPPLEECVTKERLCVTFIHTICEIQPHRLYPSGDVDYGMFSAVDMEYVILSCVSTLEQIISTDLNKQLEINEVIDNSNGIRFLSHCIQMIGVFAAMARSNPDRRIKFINLKSCCLMFGDGIVELVNCDHLPDMDSWMQFRHVIGTCPSLRHYVVETIRELTAAITNYKPGDIKEMLMYLRDILAEDLGVCHNICKLPGLLLSRQVQGPTLVHQHTLLLRRLADDNIFVTIPFRYRLTDSNSDRWLKISLELPDNDDISSDDSSDDSGDDLSEDSGDESGGDSGDESGGDSGDESGDESGGDSGDESGDESGGDSGDEAGGDSGDESGGDSGDESGDELGGDSGDD